MANVTKETKKYRFIDLFAGMGGFRLGFEQAGFECVFSSEWDRHAQNTYFQNYGEYPRGDIREIEGSQIPDHEVLLAGFPCQTFSIAGNRQGFLDETRGTLFFEVARILKEKRPKAFVLENVKGLISHDQGRSLEVILGTLRELGYQVKWKLLNSKDYGVPQNRERIFIVGWTGDQEFQFPEPIPTPVTVADILEANPEPQLFLKPQERATFAQTAEEPASPAHKICRLGHIMGTQGQGYRVYSIQGLSQCLAANTGGKAGQAGLYILPSGEIRTLSPRECARVQGYPDSYWLPQSPRLARKQLGNSVSVPVICALAAALNLMLNVKAE